MPFSTKIISYRETYEADGPLDWVKGCDFSAD